MAVAVDPFFASLLPPLSTQEYELLRQTQIKAGRIVEDLDIWHGLLVDGHHRFRIAEEAGLRYALRIIDPDLSKDQVILYVLEKHLGRRNLSQDNYDDLIAKYYQTVKLPVGKPPTVAKLGEIRPITQTISTNELPTGGPPEAVEAKEPGRTRDLVADAVGVTPAAVRRAVERAAMHDKLFGGLKEALANAGKRLSNLQLKRLSNMTISQQDEVAKCLAKTAGHGGIGIEQAIHEICRPEEPEQSAADRMKTANSEIESACRTLQKLWADSFRPLSEKNPWLQRNGAYETAFQSMRAALATMRQCKGVAECLQCDGLGCKTCLETGWVDRLTSEQMK